METKIHVRILANTLSLATSARRSYAGSSFGPDKLLGPMMWNCLASEAVGLATILHSYIGPRKTGEAGAVMLFSGCECNVQRAILHALCMLRPFSCSRLSFFARYVPRKRTENAGGGGVRFLLSFEGWAQAGGLCTQHVPCLGICDVSC